MSNRLDPSDDDTLLAFMPVPLQRARCDGWTAARQRAFVAALRDLACVTSAARRVGMTRQSATRLRKRPGAAAFAEAWDLALAEGHGRVFDDTVERCMNGEWRPIVRHGRLAGWTQRYDNRLAYAVAYGQAPPSGS